MAAEIIPIRNTADDHQPPPKSDARARARYHLEQALATGVRGTLRDAIKAALDLAAGTRAKDLTDLEYQALKPGQKLVDPTRPGFLAKASRNGVRFIYRHNDPVTNARTENGLGYLGAVTLAQAREKWAELRARRMNGSPVLVEDAGSPISKVPTLRELVRTYLSDYAEKVKRSWRDDERLLGKHVLPRYGDLPATDFTSDMVADLLAGLARTPREAEKLRASLQTLFNVAVGKTKRITLAKTWLPRSRPNPVANVMVGAHAPARHSPHEGEIKRYATALRVPGTLRGDIADVLQLQLLTACRINEAAGARWDEMDLQYGKWHIPGARMKNGDNHTVILSRQALALLERRRNLAVGPYVFHRPTNAKQPLRAEVIQKALAENRATLGVAPEFTSHSVRHAFMSWAGSNLYPVEVRNRCTAHRMTNGIDGVYCRPELDQPAAALWQAWAKWLDE